MLASPLVTLLSTSSRRKTGAWTERAWNGQSSVQSRRGDGLKVRSYCKAQKPQETYKPSYDPRRPSVAQTWPRSRREELSGIAKKVHPTAIVREAAADKFSYRVRIKEFISPSKDDDIVGPVQGLLKPPPIMQKTDPFVREQQAKRKARVEEILRTLRAGNENLTITQVNAYYQELESIKMEARQEGFDLVVDQSKQQTETMQKHILSGSEDQSSLSSSLGITGNTSHDSLTSKSTQTMQYGSKKIAGRDWTLAGDVIMRRRIEELLANESEHLQAGSGGVMGAARRREKELKEEAAQVINILTLPRLFGFVAQAALVFPFALLKGIRKLSEPEEPRSILATGMPRTPAEARWQNVDLQVKEAEKQLAELTKMKEEFEASVPFTLKYLYTTRVLIWRVLGLLFRTVFVYPVKLAVKLVKFTGLWVYYLFYAPYDIVQRIYKVLPVSIRESMLVKPLSTTYQALAPVAWKRYQLGDPVGTLWDRNTGHGTQTFEETRNAFNDINYGLERLIFGFFHSNRLFGLIGMVAITGVLALNAIQYDPAAVVELFHV